MRKAEAAMWREGVRERIKAELRWQRLEEEFMTEQFLAALEGREPKLLLFPCRRVPFLGLAPLTREERRRSRRKGGPGADEEEP